MIDLHVKNAANSLLDYLTDGVENIHEKPWLKTATCSNLMRLLRIRKNPVLITENEACQLYEDWIKRKQELIKNGS